MLDAVDDGERAARRAVDSEIEAQQVFDAVVTNGLLSDAWRLTLWSNYYTEPIFTALDRDFDVGRDEFNVLSCLASYGPMAAKTICEVTGRPKNSISRGVTRLTERRLIRRKTNPLDRRESALILNASGRTLYERVLPVAVERQTLMLRGLSEVERATLDQLLGKLMRTRGDW